MSTEFGKTLLNALSDFSARLENGEEIEVSEVQKVQTPDGSLHLRRKFRLNENVEVKRCLVGRLRLLKNNFLPSNLVEAEVCGRRVIVGDHYDDGVLGIFIPEGAIVPDNLADEMWVKGKLSGKKKNRVKSRKISGANSEGLFYGSRFFIMNAGQKEYLQGASWNLDWVEGQDVTEEIGVIFND